MSYAPEVVPARQRATAVIAIALVHVGIFAAVKNGMARQITDFLRGPVTVRLIEEEVILEEAGPPPIPVQIETPPPFIPEPEIYVEEPPQPQSTTAINAIVTSALPPPPTPHHHAALIERPIIRTELRIDARRSPSTNDYYPPASRRLGEEGTTTVEVCVGPDGKVIGRAHIVQVSGVTRLDEAAEKYAARTRWIPASENGRPVRACGAFNVKFVLQ